jgi:hypothetical protein
LEYNGNKEMMTGAVQSWKGLVRWFEMG